MKKELYINDELIDLFPNERIAFTFQANKVGDVKNHRAHFSRSIKLPKTKNNLKVLGFPNTSQSDQTIYQQSLDARYVVDGVEMISNGRAVLGDTSSTIRLTIYAGSFKFFDSIKGTLRDLDFSSDDFVYTSTNVAALMNDTTGLCFPVFDTGTLVNNDQEYHMLYGRHSYHVADIITKIFTTAGINKSGALLSTAPYTRMILPALRDDYWATTDILNNAFQASRITSDWQTILSFYQTAEYNGESSDPKNAYDNTTFTYTVQEGFTGIFRAGARIENDNPSNDGDFDIRIRRTNNAGTTTLAELTGTTIPASTTVGGDFNRDGRTDF